MPRIHHPFAIHTGQALLLSAEGARHVQVLRLQPGDGLTLFGDPERGGEYQATVLRMGRSEVEVEVGAHHAVERAASRAVHLAVGMPANERMDWLVEKATELGVTRITPLMTERSVLRLSGERADKKQAHWQAVAASACEQCGRNRLPLIDAPVRWEPWLSAALDPQALRAVLSLHASTQSLVQRLQSSQAVGEHAAPQPWVVLSGPEGGLSDTEDAAARANGFAPITLGARVLRAETAALGALALLTLA